MQLIGPNCTRLKNACETAKCAPNQKCVDFGNFYRCECSPGFYGEFCSHMLNPCSSYPCKKNATCQQISETNYTCHCPYGWSGQNCSELTNFCELWPCDNGAECLQMFGGRQCLCKEGFTGSNCSARIEFCSLDPLPCHNNSTCDSFRQTCNCSHGWQGPKCDSIVDSCSSSPCPEGVECINLLGDYKCNCSQGQTGRNCENFIFDCREDLCLNGGNCVEENLNDDLNYFACECPEGFTGDLCEIPLDPCRLDPCRNNGTCLSRPDGTYECRCDDNNCEESKITCATHNPCKNGGTCENSFMPICKCPPSYVGLYCDKERDANFNLYFASIADKPDGYKSPAISSPLFNLKQRQFTLVFWVKFSPDASQNPNIDITYLTLFQQPVKSSDKPTILVEFLSWGFHLVNMTSSSRVKLFVNDSLWHHITLLWDIYTLQTYVDGKIAANLNFQTNDIPTNRLKVILGRPIVSSPTTASSFTGELSLVTIFSRILTEDEISRMFHSCSVWFDRWNQAALVNLRWIEFDKPKEKSTVLVKFPGICKVSPCLPGHQNCLVDKIPPEIRRCPADIHVVGDPNTRLRQIDWPLEPDFRDNIEVTSVVSNYRKYQTLPWGSYQVIFVATDNSSNSAMCSFKWIFSPFQCRTPPDPVNGIVQPVQFCKESAICQYFTIDCRPNFAFYQAVKPFYSCGPEGSWDIQRPNSILSFSFPPCSPIVEAILVEFRGRLAFPHQLSCVAQTESQFRREILVAMGSLLDSDQMDSNSLIVECSNGTSHGRIKRDSNSPSGSIFTFHSNIS